MDLEIPHKKMLNATMIMKELIKDGYYSGNSFNFNLKQEKKYTSFRWTCFYLADLELTSAPRGALSCSCWEN